MDQEANNFETSSRVKFENEFQRHEPPQLKPSGIVRLMIGYSGGLIKNQKEAERLLIFLSMVAVLVSITVLYTSTSPEVKINGRDTFKNAPPEVRAQFK